MAETDFVRRLHPLRQAAEPLASATNRPSFDNRLPVEVESNRGENLSEGMSVPTTALQGEAATGAGSSDLRGISELIPVIRSAFDALRQQLGDARGTIAHLREQNARLLDLSTVDALQQQLTDARGTIAYLREKNEKNERLLDLVAPRRPWWRRWFG